MIVTIKKGNHNQVNLWHMLTSLVCRSKLKKTLVIKGEFKTPPYDPQGDKDLSDDWNKIGGLNMNAFQESDINSIMGAFRSDGELWEMNLFWNIDDNDFWMPEPIKSKGEFEIRIKRNDKGFLATLTTNGLTMEKQLPHQPKWCTRLIRPWFGGDDNDKNGLGGVAPEDITLEINYTWE